MAIPKTQKVVLIDGVSETYEVIKYQDYATPEIKAPKDMLVKNLYAGVNFIEAYFRKGYYPAQFPYVLGREAVGEVVSVGTEVNGFKTGDKVLYCGGATFAQYTKVNESADIITKLPADTTEKDLQLYGSFSVQSTTAYTFSEDSYNAQPNDFILVWAAAGGVGQILVQILSNRGCKVIALASSDEKLKLVKDLGAAYTINYKTEDVVSKVKEITNGSGVRASYDSVGKASYQTSLDCLGIGGHFISYGNSSGKVPPVDIYTLTPKNISITRPNVRNFLNGDRYDYYMKKIFDDLKSGKVKYEAPKVHDLKDYAKVAELLESGSTTGKFVLKIDP